MFSGFYGWCFAKRKVTSLILLRTENKDANVYHDMDERIVSARVS